MAALPAPTRTDLTSLGFSKREVTLLDWLESETASFPYQNRT